MDMEERMFVCGGIPRVYLFGGESAFERLALQNICVGKGRLPTEAERQQIRAEAEARRLTID
jgi:hypothetical protein